MLNTGPLVKIAQLVIHIPVKALIFRQNTIMRKQFTMDKDDRKYLIWFLVGLVIAAIPWIIGMI